ncbi:MAG: hypothetical protein G8D58_03215 [gamma proteobacterium symbiont of Phacoides pectinatus]
MRFEQQGRDIIQQAASAAQSWLELRQRLTGRRTPSELELEVVRRFLNNIALGMGEHSWLSRNC